MGVALNETGLADGNAARVVEGRGRRSRALDLVECSSMLFKGLPILGRIVPRVTVRKAVEAANVNGLSSNAVFERVRGRCRVLFVEKQIDRIQGIKMPATSKHKAESAGRGLQAQAQAPWPIAKRHPRRAMAFWRLTGSLECQ